MPMLRLSVACCVLCSLLLATEPDAATRRWWGHVVTQANDGMEGRDTGSVRYRRAPMGIASPSWHRDRSPH
jgi:hypothetical protein